MHRMVVRSVLAVAVIAMLAAGYAAFARQRSAPRQRTFLSLEERTRQALFDQLRPVGLKNCDLERFGEANDGGYLLCGNLLGDVQSAYSYGISGYDGWGCDVSRRLNVPVHQYDCFDTRRPACAGGTPVFHAECIGPKPGVEEGRAFDTLQRQIARNGDAGKDLVVKMDVERAEWDSLLETPSDVLDRIAQLAIEFHGTDEVRFIVTLQKLRELFHVAHVHFNNHSCIDGAKPFPADAYEVLLVNKRLATLDPSAAPGWRHPLDAPNNPEIPDCQAALSHLPAGMARNANPVSLAWVR